MTLGVRGGLELRHPTPADFPGMIALCERVYPSSAPWKAEQLASHLEVFPQGQFVICEREGSRILAMASSLIVRWDDYAFAASWREWTDHGYFTNHDPQGGRTLYGAEVMVDPATRGSGLGKWLYAARRDLVLGLGLLRIRAGARLRGYHRYAEQMTPEEYVEAVVRGKIGDPTLSFQLSQGFEVLAVVPSYLRNDPESRGHAAVIEWLNPEAMRPEDAAGRDSRYLRPGTTS